MKKLNLFSSNLVAASPVIGVMLMVVVTVILAAAVSSYSTGMLKGSEPVPSASFNVEMRVDVPSVDTSTGADMNISYIAITMVTGDKIPTDELKIITINPNARGNNKTREILPNVNNTKTGQYTGVSPFLNVGKILRSDSTGVYFGDFVLEPGMTMIADEYSNYQSAASWEEDIGAYNLDSTPIDPNSVSYITGMQTMFADWGDNPDGAHSINPGDVITIKIIHTPSNKVIFTKDVVVSE
ncbi:MAG: archaeal type pilus assembly protein PilA [Methanolobus sp.]|jgi:FlaG/FlaF family flagellin (archaellin)|nr:archaeal type pilus assembly protein PilA [Methanolobus sp.]